jgi:hypothetical protein
MPVLTCPHCSFGLAVPSDRIGGNVLCTACRKWFPTSADAPRPEDDEPDTARQGWGAYPWLVAVAALLVITLFLTWRARRVESARAEAELRAVEASLVEHDKERLAALRDRVRVITEAQTKAGEAGRAPEEPAAAKDPGQASREQELRQAEEEIDAILRRHPGWAK